MAKRSGFDGVLNSSEDGKPMAGILWTVYDANNNAATLYADKTSGAFKTNGIDPTGSNGLIQFWVAPGYYEIEVTDTHVPARIATRRIPFNGVAGDIAGIDSDQIDFTSEPVASGDMKIRSYYQNGAIVSGTADHVFASQGGVEPGIYQAVGSISTDGAGSSSLRFDNSTGTATFYNAAPTGTATAVSAIIVVTATATIRLRGQMGAGFGAYGSFTLLGVAS